MPEERRVSPDFLSAVLSSLMVERFQSMVEPRERCIEDKSWSGVTTLENDTTSPLLILPRLPQDPMLTTTSAPVITMAPAVIAEARMGPTPETKVRKSPLSPLSSALSEATTSIFFIRCRVLQLLLRL